MYRTAQPLYPPRNYRGPTGPWGSLVYPWWFGTTRLRFKSGRTHPSAHRQWTDSSPPPSAPNAESCIPASALGFSSFPQGAFCGNREFRDSFRPSSRVSSLGSDLLGRLVRFLNVPNRKRQSLFRFTVSGNPLPGSSVGGFCGHCYPFIGLLGLKAS